MKKSPKSGAGKQQGANVGNGKSGGKKMSHPGKQQGCSIGAMGK